jgi:hypothetical protein
MVKFTIIMDINTVQTPLVSPPKIITSILAGFNAAANNIYLIIMPIILDLFFLFGPKLRLKNLLDPYLEAAIQNLSSFSSGEMMNMVDLTKEMWNAFLTQYNLFSLLRTYPIGIPSLLAGQPIQSSPLGRSLTYEVNTWGELFFYSILLILVGIFIGSIYFNEVERNIRTNKRRYSYQVSIWQIIQSYLLTAILLFLLLLFLVPASILISIIAIFSPVIGQITLLIGMLITIWIFIPLFFSPHGIFASHQNALISVISSYRLIKSYLPGTGLFMVLILIISQGLNFIWLIPPSTSWFILVGIAGHSFVSTSLLAASFNYYLLGTNWMRAVIERQAPGKEVKAPTVSN